MSLVQLNQSRQEEEAVITVTCAANWSGKTQRQTSSVRRRQPRPYTECVRQVTDRPRHTAAESGIHTQTSDKHRFLDRSSSQ